MTKAIILIIALGLVALLPSKLIADDSVKWSNDPLPKEMTTLEMIKYYSGKYGSDPSEVYSVGMCESGLRNNVVGDNGHSFGATLAPLCIECHEDFHAIYGVKKNMQEEMVEFMLKKVK